MIQVHPTHPSASVMHARTGHDGVIRPAAGAGFMAAALLAAVAAQASPREPAHASHAARAFHASQGSHGSHGSHAETRGPGAGLGGGHAMHLGGHHRGQGHGGLGLSPRMLERIEATPEQREKLRAIAEAARHDLRAQHDAGRALRERSMELLQQAQVDAAALEALRQQMLAQHDRASQRRLQALVDASRVLTPEQRQRLGEDVRKRRDMMERHQRERRSLDAPKS